MVLKIKLHAFLEFAVLKCSVCIFDNSVTHGELRYLFQFEFAGIILVMSNELKTQSVKCDDLEMNGLLLRIPDMYI